MSETETPTQRVGQLLKARYRIERVLHAGERGCVYAGTDTKVSPPARVALKLFGPEQGCDVERRVRQAYLANAVGHPGAVTVLDAGLTEEGATFLVMELLDAPSLLALRASHGGKLPLRLACAIADQCLDLLACAHPQQIAHGAIGPECLFWSRGSRLRMLGLGAADTAEPDLVRADLRAVAALWQWLLGEPSPAVPQSIQAVFDRARAHGWPSADAMRRALARAHSAELGRRIDVGHAAAVDASSSWLRVWLVAVGLAGVVLFLTSLGAEHAPRPGAASRRETAPESEQAAVSEQTPASEPAALSGETFSVAPGADVHADQEPAGPGVAAASRPQTAGARVIPRGPTLPELRTPMRGRAAADGGDAPLAPGLRSGLSPLATAHRLCTDLAARRRQEQALSDAEQRAWDEHCQKH